MPLDRRNQGARPVLLQPEPSLEIQRSLEKAADLEHGVGARRGAGDRVGDPQLAMSRELRAPPVAGGQIVSLELRRRATGASATAVRKATRACVRMTPPSYSRRPGQPCQAATVFSVEKP